jgi:hypothetical protein
MEPLLYGLMILAVVVGFCILLLGFLVLATAAVMNDPEFMYADDMRDLEHNGPAPLLGVVSPKEKRDINA